MYEHRLMQAAQAAESKEDGASDESKIILPN